MDTQYNHKLYEEETYSRWEKSSVFSPSKKGIKTKPFTIIMPPPNANDPLHIGHAMFITIEDILIRFHRMLGESALWLPGTDHAGIETQYVFEKKLSKEGKSRFDYDRSTLYKLIWDYVQKNSGVAITQMKRLGASADWSKFKFTLDPDVVSFVTDTFIKLYNDGLIYRGERLVNYCTKCGTGYSELEVEYAERQDPFYFIKYGPFIISTARPETKFRDTALAVNPKDKRYKKHIGKTFEIDGLLGPIKMIVVPDPDVDPKFGTGIMKVTPAHDHHDFELGQKFNLPVTPIITTDGKMDFSWYLDSLEFSKKPKKYRDRAQMYHRMKVSEARLLMAQHLSEDGLLVKTDEKYVHRVATCYRCHGVIEPLPIPQFFVKVEPLTKKAIKSLDNKETVVLGAGREKILRHWLNNLRDWNISRQIVWGIRIPVWYSITDNPNMEIVFLNSRGERIRGIAADLVKTYGVEEIEKGLQKIGLPKNAKFVVSHKKPSKDFLQETDTFDTWFSSGQWPVVTLKTSGEKDFSRFYPTSVMETGYDILPIWVMRMMLLGIYLTGKSPFKTVYLHGLIRDEQGRKMSKSVGNVINPIDMVDKYGADALRMALVLGSTPGTDKNVGEATIRGMRNFSNKIWNAARYVSLVNESSGEPTKESFKLTNKLEKIVEEITKNLNGFKIGLAAEKLYGYFWHWFCDECIEKNKNGEISNKELLRVLTVFLKLIHPFMPFVTEAIWNEIPTLRVRSEKLLASSLWPTKVT